MTSKEKSMYNNYLYADYCSELWEVYGSFSHAKVNAMEYCKRLQREKNGYGAKIVSHNTFMFTYAFKYDKDDHTYMMYITPSYDYDFEVA